MLVVFGIGIALIEFQQLLWIQIRNKYEAGIK